MLRINVPFIGRHVDCCVTDLPKSSLTVSTKTHALIVEGSNELVYVTLTKNGNIGSLADPGEHIYVTPGHIDGKHVIALYNVRM